MNALSISQLSRFSGIKPFTIRMWEQRYHALRPKRTDGNTRTYNSLDLRRLLNIVSLQEAGYKISEIGGNSDDNLCKLVAELYELEQNDNPMYFIPQLISAGIEFDEVSFCKILSHCMTQFGIFRAYRDVMYPLLNRAGLMWASDNLPPAQEHFMSNLIRQKLLSQIDALPAPDRKNKKWLLFLPEDEFHEIGLLFAHYVLKHHGVQVISLGANVPLATLDSAIDSINPDSILLFFVHFDLPADVGSYLYEIENKFKKGTIYISGNEKLISQIDLGERMKWLREIDDLEHALTII